ncbi:MAG: hypothetical protein WC793_03390 [Candidatus Paceibacterota bacterium]|jgi:hypothetical protein
MKNNLQKILLFISATLLLFFCFALIFLYRKVNDNNQKIQQNTITLQTEARRREDVSSLNRALQKNTSDRVLLEDHFVKSSDIVPFLNTIETLAKRAVVSVQIDSINTKTNNPELTIGLKASGKFEAIYKFLVLLENAPYEIDFVSMDMHKLFSPVVVGKNMPPSEWEVIFKIQLISFIP